MENEKFNFAMVDDEDVVQPKQLWALEAFTIVSRALGKAKTPQALVEQLCKAVTNMPPYMKAWIGSVNDDSAKTIEVVGSFGALTASGYLRDIYISWDASRPEGQGPVGQSVRSGETTIINDIGSDKNFILWRDRAYKHGIRSALSIPIHGNSDKVNYVFVVYASEPQGFDDYHIRVFECLAQETVARLAEFKPLPVAVRYPET